jgi:hypothetical protein
MFPVELLMQIRLMEVRQGEGVLWHPGTLARRLGNVLSSRRRDLCQNRARMRSL